MVGRSRESCIADRVLEGSCYGALGAEGLKVDRVGRPGVALILGVSEGLEAVCVGRHSDRFLCSWV